MIVYKDEKFGFIEIFNEKNGTLIRSDVEGKDPSMRSFPELLDVGIMGHCENGVYCKKAGIDCYQKGNSVFNPHMSAKQFENIAKQASGKTFQIALGGAGDPNKHPEFEQILRLCRYYKIVPNMTTSGMNMSHKEIVLMKKYCGAVAVSWYSRLGNGVETNLRTLEAVEKLVNYGCTTNIHYVISNDTIDEAIYRLQNNLFPQGINAVIFILYKPVGDGIEEKTLRHSDTRLDAFLKLATEQHHPYSIGFDTCFTPAIVTKAKQVPNVCIDSCEAATFSMYIDSQMNCYPCSFGVWNKKISECLISKSIEDIWNGTIFKQFRRKSALHCMACEQYHLCTGGCKLNLDIDLC